MSGRSRSRSVRPVALSIARAGARLGPFVKLSLRIVSSGWGQEKQKNKKPPVTTAGAGGRLNVRTLQRRGPAPRTKAEYEPRHKDEALRRIHDVAVLRGHGGGIPHL